MKVKRIIGNRTYNTETAALISARATKETQEDLHLSRSGNYFLVKSVRDENGDLTPDEIVPMTPDQARSWHVCEGNGKPDDWFGEIVGDNNGEAVVSLRLPKLLLHYITTHASALGQSRNAWINNALVEELRRQSGGRFFPEPGVPTKKSVVSYSDD